MRRLLLFLVLALGSTASAGTPVAGFEDDPYVVGLSNPTAIAFLPNGDLLITQKTGALLRFDGTSTVTLATIPVCSGAEMGLLGIAVDPDFATNGYVYLYRSDSSAGCASATGRFNEVVRVTVVGNSAGSLVEILTGIRTDTGFHDGGGLRIGLDGKLYVAVGDTAVGDGGPPGASTNPYAQDLAALEGKILRLNLDGSIPADNPFVGSPPARGEVFASGFRNPYRMGVDPVTGALWVGDVGQNTLEEIDLVTSGGDYAWPHCEGTLPVGCHEAGETPPVLDYPRTGPVHGATVTAGAFAPAGSGFGGLDGDYFFGDFVDRVIYHAVLNGPRTDIVGTPTEFVTSAGGVFGGPVDIIFGPDGALYYLTLNPGEVRRVAPGPGGGAQPLSGKRLVLRATPVLRALSKDTTVALGGGNGSADDPVVNGGSLRVASAGFDDTYGLPASGWSYVGSAGQQKGYRYSDRSLANGPVKFVLVRNGRVVRIVGKGAGLGQSLAADPDPVDLVLTTGARTYCMQFGGATTFNAGVSFVARDATAPGACPP